jgi:hypothetical protein
MPSDGCGVPFQKWILWNISMKIALTLIMELADFIILLIWTLRGKLARISKPRRKQKLNPARVIEKRENDASVRIGIVKCLFATRALFEKVAVELFTPFRFNLEK